MQTKIELLSELLRDMEAEAGTNAVALNALYSLTASLNSFSGESFCDFLKEFETLFDNLSKTKPRFGILNYHFGALLCEFREWEKDKTIDKKNWKEQIVKKVLGILQMEKDHENSILDHSDEINVDNKTILIHDHSHTVQKVLKHYKNRHQHFKVIVAEQDYEKTHGNIEFLYENGIPFQVIPAYMLSQIDEEIDMAFFGALTLKSTMDFVTDPGTHGIITEFHVAGIPVYMFIDTAKFSLWKSKKKEEVFMRKHIRRHYSKPIDYERVKYSHDRVPAKLFKRIVTNAGVFTPASLKKLYMDKFKKCDLF